MFKGIQIAVLCLLFSTASQAGVFNPKTKTLENGLQVVVVENQRAPVVTHMVWYKVGAMDEPAGKSGLAHYLEHLMFKKTKKLASGEFSKIVSRNGGSGNAFTSQDYTGYYQSVAVSRLPLMMELEAERMVNLELLSEDIEPEREVIQEERRSRTENDPGARLHEQAAAALYFNHPYRIPIIGWAHEIDGLTLEDLTRFYKAYYAPNNAIVVVAGAVKAEEVFAMAEKYYGPLKPSDTIPTPVDWKEPPKTTDRVVSLEDPRVTQESWSRQKDAPNRNGKDDPRTYALEILADILGGGSTSRLYKKLVVEEKIATSAGAWYRAEARGPTVFGVYGSPRDGYTIDDVRAAVDAELERLLKDGVTEDEVTRAIQRVQDSSVLALDSLTTPARVLGAALSIGRSIEDVEAWPDRIAEVTVERVNDVAREVLTAPGSLETLLLPEKKG